MCFDVPLNSLQAAVIHDHMRSRVAGAFSSINYGVRPLGAVVGGFLGTWIGVRETLLVSAAGGLFVGPVADPFTDHPHPRTDRPAAT